MMFDEELNEMRLSVTNNSDQVLLTITGYEKEIKDLQTHIKSVNHHLDLLSKRRSNDTAPVFITIDNDCVAISGKYAEAVQFGLHKILEDLRYDLAAKKLQLNDLHK